MSGVIVKGDPGDVRRREHRPKRDIPPAVRRRVLAADSCRYCGDILLPREVEHYIPRARGGGNDEDNLVAACVSCNFDKKTLLMHEWRTLRQAHGLPWPPLASHATDRRHYGDFCKPCRNAAPRPWPPHRFVVTPHLLVVDGLRFVAHYACPVGHRWPCRFTPDDSYYSDCPCLFCWHSREDDGAKHWIRPARWNEIEKDPPMLALEGPR